MLLHRVQKGMPMLEYDFWSGPTRGMDPLGHRFKESSYLVQNFAHQRFAGGEVEEYGRHRDFRFSRDLGMPRRPDSTAREHSHRASQQHCSAFRLVEGARSAVFQRISLHRDHEYLCARSVSMLLIVLSIASYRGSFKLTAGTFAESKEACDG